MALTWAGVITILFLAAACVRGYRRGLIKELVSLVCVFLSMAIVWLINPYVNEFIRENTSIYEKVQESCREFVGEEYSTWTGSGESQTEFINEMNLPELLRNGLVQNNNSDSYQYLAVTTFGLYCSISGENGSEWNFFPDFSADVDDYGEEYHMDAESCDEITCAAWHEQGSRSVAGGS